MSLGDLDELTQSCRDDEARKFIAEAVACYRAGSYKACIVSTWIAVVYDLLAKFRELALGGDAQAQALTSELSNLQPKIALKDGGAIKRILEIERTSLEIANDQFGFFDGQQLIDLNRLRDDRNRCAHPTYQGMDQPYTPSAELARSHLVHAVAHVLSVPPVQGRAAAAHIVRLVESAYFPTDVELAKTQLRAGGLERPKDSLVREVVDRLVFGLFEGAGPLKGRIQTASAIRAVQELFPGVAEPRMQRALNMICRRASDGDLSRFFAVQVVVPTTWGFLEADNQNRLAALLDASNDEIALKILPVCVELAPLQVKAAQRVKKLDAVKVGELVKRCKHDIVVTAAVDLYCTSRNWDQANSRYHSVVEPVLTKLSDQAIRRILIASRDEGADLRGAHSFSGFVRHIYESERIPREELLETLKSIDAEYLADWLGNPVT